MNVNVRAKSEDGKIIYLNTPEKSTLEIVIDHIKVVGKVAFVTLQVSAYVAIIVMVIMSL